MYEVASCIKASLGLPRLPEHPPQDLVGDLYQRAVGLECALGGLALLAERRVLVALEQPLRLLVPEQQRVLLGARELGVLGDLVAVLLVVVLDELGRYYGTGGE